MYFGAIVFFVFPLYYLWLGIVLPIHVVLMSLGSAVVFGFFATRQWMKYEAYKEKFPKVDDKILKMQCPKCNEGRLVELTSPRENFVVNSYKGLVYCTLCEFELSKDEFDKKYGSLKDGQ